MWHLSDNTARAGKPVYADKAYPELQAVFQKIVLERAKHSS
jgi:hypothetical protein